MDQTKLAHQFWISYPPPGAGSSTSSKEKEKQQQAEEEKRTTTSREQRQIEYDAAIKEHHRCQREQWEIRQLDNDLLQQRHSEREREREEKELAGQLLLFDERDTKEEFTTPYTCRAPIASLDCMEEFSAGSTLSALADRSNDSGITKEQILLSNLSQAAPNASLQITKQTNVTPGLRYRNLGKSGLRVSNIGLGTWPTFGPNVTEEQAEQIIVLAVESGINVFDLSEAHSGTRAEVELGRILARKGWKRTTYVVTTKIYWSTRSEERGLSRKHIIESVKASLLRLQLSYIDVVIVHKADPMCPMEEVVRAMHYVISQGWVMYWGTARWSPVEVMEAYTNCRQFNCVTPIVEQTEYHMFCREKTELYMPELYNKIGVGLMAWSHISMGLSQGKDEGNMQLFSRSSFRNKYSSFSWTEDETNAPTKDGCNWMKDRLQPEESRRQSERIRELTQMAEKLGCSLSQLAIAWCLKNESVQCLLLGASTVGQLYDNIQSLQISVIKAIEIFQRRNLKHLIVVRLITGAILSEIIVLRKNLVNFSREVTPIRPTLTMDLALKIYVVLVIITLNAYEPASTQPIISSNYLRQEHSPVIDYKYIVKTILPMQGNWWKRGTHHFYGNSEVKVVQA